MVRWGHAGAPARDIRSRRMLALGIAGLTLLMAGLGGTLLWRLRAAALADAEGQVRTTVGLLAQGVGATLDRVAVGLSGVADQLERAEAEGRRGDDGLWRLVDGAAAHLPEVAAIGVFGADGRQRCGQPVSRCRGLDIAERDYFQALRARPSAAVALYGPHRSLLDDHEALVLARALRDADGGFAGVVLALVPARALEPLVAAAHLGPGGATSLRMADGLHLVARAPSLPAAVRALPGSAQVSEDLLRQLAAAPRAAVYRSSSRVDGIERINGYQAVTGWPLLVVAGDALDDVMLAWRQAAWGVAGFMALFGLLAWALYRTMRRALAQQQRAEALYDSAPCGYHSLDADGRVLDINATELAWLGQRRRELLGRRRWDEGLDDDNRARHAARLAALVAGETALPPLELDLPGPAGRQRRVALDMAAVRDGDGRFLRCHAVLHDVSAEHRHRQAQQALARQQGLMLDAELVGIARLQGGRLAWVNRGMQRLFGHPPAAWALLDLAALFADAATAEGFARDAAAAFAAGRACRLQAPMRRHDGATVWVDLSAARLDEAGDAVLLLMVDLTPIRAAEAARLQTVELAAENRQLRETARQKDAFVATLSHELRTPLNGVMGFTQLLRAPGGLGDPAQALRYLDQIAASGEQLLALIDTLLDHARAEAGQIDLALAPLAPGPLLQAAVDAQRPRAEALGLQLALATDPGLGSVSADPLRLRQMVDGLLDNALKFSRPGGRVRVQAAADGDAHWAVAVTDEGIGIAEADLPRLFVPFRQLSTGIARSHGGIGLGLALVRRIARALGGDVTVHSRPGEGSTFTLRLPRTLAPDPGP